MTATEPRYGKQQWTRDELWAHVCDYGYSTTAYICRVSETRLRLWLEAPGDVPQAPSRPISDAEREAVLAVFAALLYPAGSLALIAGRCGLGRERTAEVLADLRTAGRVRQTDRVLWRLA